MTIHICGKLLQKYIYTLLSYQYRRQSNAREIERKENMLCSPQGMLVGQAVKITYKPHKLLW